MDTRLKTSTSFVLRQTVLIFIGFIAINFARELEFEGGWYELFIVLFSFLAIPTALWIISKDLSSYRISKQKHLLLSMLIGFIAIASITIISLRINAQFNSPTLLKVFLDGDFNGISIDFKEDGHFILGDWAVGFSDYSHGEYQIDGDTLRLFSYKPMRLKEFQTLIIRPQKITTKTTLGRDSIYYENYALPLSDQHNFNRAFRIIEDNRIR